VADHAHSDDPAVQAQLDRLTMLSPGRDVLGLERISALMERLGNPHRRLPRVFHVAGTNGKGSTCAFLRAALEAAGKTVHVYSSPHLVRFNERIRVAGSLIDDATLAPLLSEVLDCSADINPSFFEATTAAAFLAFCRTQADATIVEVGLGGRLDATNVIEHPLICGIAQLGVDHQAFLGDDPAIIAGEKAGIAKANVPIVTMAYGPAETARIFELASAAGAPVLMQGRDWTVEVAADGLTYADERGLLSLPRPRLAGAHQANNAGLAIAMLRHQSAIEIPAEALASGIANASWPARLQRLGEGPIVRHTADRTSIWIDGCHNPASARIVAAQLPTLFGEASDVALICGVLANKDAAGILAPFLGTATRFATVPIPGHPHHDPMELARWIRGKGGLATAHPDVHHAIERFTTDEPPRAILILGSLYLAGEVLRANGQVPD
jgi:dihydrofolate synthase / folylpolyglutamate synthase